LILRAEASPVIRRRKMTNMDRMPDVEVPLTGGRSTTGVVRLGDTVRRPASSRSPFIRHVLRHLEAREFSGAPRFLGVDEGGRDILSYVPGVVPAELGEVDESQCIAAARLLRELHDATTDCELKGSGEVICHGDPSPCNCVFVEGVPRAFIDFDDAREGDRADDLGYAAWLWLDFGNGELSAEDQGRRLAEFALAYDPRARWDVPGMVLAAQERVIQRPGAPSATREWAGECKVWTLDNLSRIRAAGDKVYA
jgi:Ser/Thr protein kinase RdoA (MazF antagonist)